MCALSASVACICKLTVWKRNQRSKLSKSSLFIIFPFSLFLVHSKTHYRSNGAVSHYVTLNAINNRKLTCSRILISSCWLLLDTAGLVVVIVVAAEGWEPEASPELCTIGFPAKWSKSRCNTMTLTVTNRNKINEKIQWHCWFGDRNGIWPGTGPARRISRNSLMGDTAKPAITATNRPHTHAHTDLTATFQVNLG